MLNNGLDDTLLREVGKGLAGEGTVDLQTVDEDGNGDEAVRLDILLKLLAGVLVEDDSVLGLVLDCRKKTCQYCVVAIQIAEELLLAYPCPWTTSSFASCHRLLLGPWLRYLSMVQWCAAATARSENAGAMRPPCLSFLAKRGITCIVSGSRPT